MSPTPSKVDSHGLAAPTLAELRAAVERSARGDETVWPAICRAAGVSPTALTADLATLERVVAAGKARGGAVGISAMSIGVRLTSFRTLSTLQTKRTA